MTYNEAPPEFHELQDNLQLIAAIRRRVRRDVPEAAEAAEAAGVIGQVCSAHGYDDPGKPAIAWDDEAARRSLVDALVRDAHRLLGHLPEAERDPKQAEALRCWR